MTPKAAAGVHTGVHAIANEIKRKKIHMLSHTFPTHRGNEDPCPERRQCSPVGWGSDWIQRGQERGRWVCIYPSASWSMAGASSLPLLQPHPASHGHHCAFPATCKAGVKSQPLRPGMGEHTFNPSVPILLSGKSN